MAEGFAVNTANLILDLLLRAVTYTAPAGCFAKLHTAAPGAAGTTAAATETTRKSVSTAGVASAGANTSNAAMTWTAVAGSEDYTHFSVWSAVTAGTFLFSGTITANPVVAGDTFTIAAGDFDVSIPVAS